MSLEKDLDETERAAAGAVRAIGALSATARQLQKAASTGELIALHKAADRLAIAVDVVRQEVGNARAAWRMSPGDEENYLRESYEAELIEQAGTVGLPVTQRDGRLLAFPLVLRILPAERAIRVNKKRIATLRPSFLINRLKVEQAKKAKFGPEKFLESMFAAYRFIVGTDGIGRVALLSTVYEALTLLPGAAADYTDTDFVRDLFLLDRSGLRQTKSGASFSLPASTGTKGSKAAFSFLASDGELVSYYGVRFGSPS